MLLGLVRQLCALETAPCWRHTRFLQVTSGPPVLFIRSQLHVCILQSMETPEQPLFTVSARVHGARSHEGHTASATAADWFPKDNGAFVSCSKDMTAKLWDPNTTALVASFSTIQPVHTLAMNAKQPLAAVACDDCCIRLLDVAAGVATHTLLGASAWPGFISTVQQPRTATVAHVG